MGSETMTEKKQRAERIDKGMIRPKPRRTHEDVMKEKFITMSKAEKLEYIQKRKEAEDHAWDLTINRFCGREGYEDICTQAKESKERSKKVYEHLERKLQGN